MAFVKSNSVTKKDRKVIGVLIMLGNPLADTGEEGFQFLAAAIFKKSNKLISAIAAYKAQT